MLRKIKNKIFKKDYKNREIEPDEIFIDSTNLPEFNIDQFEGRIEKPISKSAIIVVGISFLIIGILFGWKIWDLQVTDGDMYASISENNRLKHSVIFADRGVIYDRNNTELAWNVRSDEDDFSRRKYIDRPGLSHTLGYVGYPLKDDYGVYYQEEFIAKDGVEKIYNKILNGKQGLKIVETDALMQVQSESVTLSPENGDNVTLSIDALVQNKFYEFIKDIALKAPFSGGAGVIMDVNTGEILSMASYPEYDSQILSDGAPAQEISIYTNNENKPFLNRAVSGLYTPGSTVKPYLAIAALNEKLIEPETQILSTGSISIPNPYFPDKESVFSDWKAHGLIDMREAIAVSSNVYFYEIGGGYEKQKGLGIKNIEKYMRMFGFGNDTGIYPQYTLSEEKGVIPNPKWKDENFKGDKWKIGDTYHTAIGQYGFQVTPLQAVRAIAAIANDGKLLTPTLLTNDDIDSKRVSVRKKYFEVVREGMRLAVTDGTGNGLNIPQVRIAAKTGTAELGTMKKFVNSLVVGFFPYENPKFAFVVIMEKGKRGNTLGALFVMKQLFEWMAINTPEYLE
jgi:penicillin-binding protein 2|tara:strand:+ start:45610 stop:47310 length:1701 start_codon:yes stop_codon:yes gene_type:complete